MHVYWPWRPRPAPKPLQTGGPLRGPPIGERLLSRPGPPDGPGCPPPPKSMSNSLRFPQLLILRPRQSPRTVANGPGLKHAAYINEKEFWRPIS